jgi:hypothetical protein
MKEPKWCSHCQKDNHSDSECWSTRVVPSWTPVMPSGIHAIPPFPKSEHLEALIAKAVRSGFEDDPEPQPCAHQEHNPPSHMVVPVGKRYRHVCPGCGSQAFLKPPAVYC